VQLCTFSNLTYIIHDNDDDDDDDDDEDENENMW
jgi:hypothetical protein